MSVEGKRGVEGREGAAGREGIPGREGEQGLQGEKGDTGAALPRSVRVWFLIQAAAFSVVLIVGGYIVHRNSEARNALCVMRADLETRTRATEKFLKDHPGPIILTLPREQFEDGLQQSKRTLNALKDLHC